MKIFILFAILGMMLFSACTEQDIEPFGERHEVYFYKYFMDEEAPGTAKADSTDVIILFCQADRRPCDGRNRSCLGRQTFDEGSALRFEGCERYDNRYSG